MHTIVIRRDVYEKHRWVAQNLFKAFVEAQKIVYQDFAQTAAMMAMLPWHNAAVEEAVELMGEDWWPYGFEANRESVAIFLKYHYECGLSKRLLEPEEVFAPETLEAFKI
jgi:4,5-dihydroxyphthalate decarboxylase